MPQVVWAGSKGVAFRWKPPVSKGKMVISEHFPHNSSLKKKRSLARCLLYAESLEDSRALNLTEPDAQGTPR